MRLKEYLNKFGTKIFKELANDINTNYVYLYQIASGKREPSAKLSSLIQEKSKGLITVYDLRKDAEKIWGKR